MKRKFLFLYLNTGAGHISAAKVLAHALQAQDPDVEIEMINGFDKTNWFGHLAFEKGYNYACNYVHGAFPLIYDIGTHRWGQDMFVRPLRFQTTRYLRHVFLEKHPTDIVSFHFALSPFVKSALRHIPWQVNFTTMVTDPFTVPHAWFYERDLKYFVYSQEAKDEAVHKCGVAAENVSVVPFLMSEKYRIPPFTKDQVREIKIKRGFDPGKKIVLLVGGGEGLPGAVDIIKECVIHKAQFSVAMVCGRDKAFKETLDILAATYPKLDLHVFGFIDYLDELVKICDCAVIKAGPATLMEVLSCRKPVIIIKYIHNQELGNMRFAVNHNVGYYIRRPRNVFRKINELLNEADFDSKMKRNFDSINLDTDAGKTATLLLER
jgi:processive 1,2-diacylglycerol beta-glucosyltransferase/1,2-diacylglycerol 3-beta-galactosyltransferase